MTFASGSFNSTLRRGNVTHYEYIQVGEGRDVGLNQISLFEAKVACGNGEQTLSRDIYRLGHRFDFFRMLLCLLFDDSRILCNEQAGAVLWSSMRSSPRTKGCTQEKSLCERAAAFDLVFTLRFYSTRHRGTEHPSFSAPNFSVSNSIPSGGNGAKALIRVLGQVTLSSSTESDKEKRVQKLSRENERKHSSGKAIRPGKRFKLRFLLAILILLRYHQISKKSRFKLCQKPFAERKFEDQDQDWIENQSPQHSIQVGLSIQVANKESRCKNGFQRGRKSEIDSVLIRRERSTLALHVKRSSSRPRTTRLGLGIKRLQPMSSHSVPVSETFFRLPFPGSGRSGSLVASDLPSSLSSSG
ncbi:hypothetical protein HN51_043441 [Arachis hypogaea]